MSYEFFILVGFIVFSDQLSKFLIIKALPSSGITLIPCFLDLKIAENQGLIFGLFQNSFSQGIWILISLLVVLFLYFYLKFWQKKQNTWLIVGFGFLAGGILGNMFDRVRQGMVTDFFDLYFKNLHWPLFNLADLAILAGIIIVLKYK